MAGSSVSLLCHLINCQLITVSIINVRSISHNICARLFTLCKISTAILRILWRHLDGSAKCLARYKVHLVWQQMSKTASKSMHYWRRHPSSNQYETDQKRGSKFGAVVAPSDATGKTTIWVHNYSPSCIQMLKKDFRKFTFCRTFGAHKLVNSFRAAFGLPIRNLTLILLSALYSDMRNFFLYRCTFTFSVLNQGI